MRVIALVIALGLQASGLWPHLNDHARREIVKATDHQPQLTLGTPTAPGESIPVHSGAVALALQPNTSAIAVDSATDSILYAQNVGTKRPIASITKLVTALVVLARHKTTELVTVGELPTYQPSDETIGLIRGETYHLGDLIKLALVPSANDAADALAIYDAGTITKFAATMNLTMSQWGIPDTHFASPSGLQDSNNFTTALSLAKIAQLALASTFIRDSVNLANVRVTSTGGRMLVATSTNQLLASGQFYGIKTGYTLQAGECFVGLTKVNGHTIITVILGSSDRFGETQVLTNWIGTNWVWL